MRQEQVRIGSVVSTKNEGALAGCHGGSTTPSCEISCWALRLMHSQPEGSLTSKTCGVFNLSLDHIKEHMQPSTDMWYHRCTTPCMTHGDKPQWWLLWAFQGPNLSNLEEATVEAYRSMSCMVWCIDNTTYLPPMSPMPIFSDSNVSGQTKTKWLSGWAQNRLHLTKWQDVTRFIGKMVVPGAPSNGTLAV